MFKTIFVPVDLAHAARLERALDVAADLAAHYGAEMVLAAVTAPTPGKLAHNPEEFRGKLDAFAADLASRYGVRARGHMVVSHDPAAELDSALMKAREETGADLVVMASHVPGVADYLLPSHGGRMASHSDVSVMVVRAGG